MIVLRVGLDSGRGQPGWQGDRFDRRGPDGPAVGAPDRRAGRAAAGELRCLRPSIALSTDGTFLGEALVDGRLQVLSSDAHAWREHALIAGRNLTLRGVSCHPADDTAEPGPSRTSGEHHIDLFWLPVLAELLTAVR